MVISFYFTSFKSMEIGIEERAIVLILEYYKAHFDLYQKINHSFFIKFVQCEE